MTVIDINHASMVSSGLNVGTLPPCSDLGSHVKRPKYMHSAKMKLCVPVLWCTNTQNNVEC